MSIPQSQSADSDILVFEQFVRTKFPVLICLFGFSGCGKTKSAIKIAKGLGGKTMFMDTETGRGRVYAKDVDGFGMGYTELTPPFTPERYIAAIKQIERAGFDNLIIDSASHEWDGLGGMLEIADANVDSKGKKRQGLGKWSVKSRHKTFMNTMMAGRMNIIICLRAKDKFIEALDQNRQKTIIMDGFVPLQERNFKYDMMIQLPMPENGEGRYIMDREKGFKCPGELLPFFKEGEQIHEGIGAKISEWVSTGAPVDEIMRQLKAEAMEHAEQGVDHFREYWKVLSKEIQLKLRPYLPNLESAAKTADLETDEEPASTGTGGSNINSLQVGITATASPPTAKEPMTLGDILDAKPTAPVRDQKDSDWWVIFDELAAQVKACKTVNQLNAFQLDNEKNILLIQEKAPVNIFAEYKMLVELTAKTFK